VSARDERLDANQRAFREANERLQELATAAGVRDGTIGHPRMEGEEIIEGNDRYEVVQKNR
jgi:hypothetical protein